MQYTNWNEQCPYAALYNYGHPVADNQFRYTTPWSNDLYELEEEQDRSYLLVTEEYLEMEDIETFEGLSRTQGDIERVLPIVFQRTANEINQAIAFGMNPNLVAYLIREMVEYIDRNYDQYNKSASYNITQASDGIKTKLYWIFNIFRIFGVPFEVYHNLLNNTVITAMQNLRVPINNSATATMR